MKKNSDKTLNNIQEYKDDDKDNDRDKDKDSNEVNKKDLLRLLEISRTISPITDPYLSAHRFGKTPYFPFVMSIEFFLQSINKVQDVFKNVILLKNLSAINPLIFRKDREKVIDFRLENIGHRNDYSFSLNDNSVGQIYFRATANLRDKKNKRDQERSSIKSAEYLENNIVIGKGVYTRKILPHGEHFQNSFEILHYSEKSAFVKQFNFNNDLRFTSELMQKDLIINPTLFDGILQLCALHSIKFNKKYILPQQIDSIYVSIEELKKSKVVFVDLEVDSNRAFCYNLAVWDEMQVHQLIVLKGVQFKDMNLSVPDLP